MPAVGSIRRSTSRLTVVLPQPDSPTSASVSPAATEKLTPSTACTLASGRPNSERRTTKCRTRPSTSSSALTRQRFSSGVLKQRDQRVGEIPTIGGGAARRAVVREWAARREAAVPAKRRAHVRHHAVDHGELVGLLVEPRHRAEQTDGVGMLGRRKQRIDRRLLDHLAGIHHGDVVAHLGDDAEVVGDEHDGGVGRRFEVAQEIEDLRLDGHIKRRRRFVRDDQLRRA